MPTGVPTVYKLIEKLDKNFDLIVILCSKNKEEQISVIKKNKINLIGIKADFYILPYTKKNNIFFKIISEVKQLFLFYLIYLKYRPSLVYLGNSNIFMAPYIRFLIRKPIVLRIMGIYDSMKKIYESKKINLINAYFRFCYRIYFNYIIFTEDGSGSRDWINHAINSNTRYSLLINGVENKFTKEINIKSFKKFADNEKFILFIGRLEPGKGFKEFIEFLEILSSSKNKFKVVIIGSGVMEKQLNYFINKNKDLNIVHISRVDHKYINYFYKNCFIFVSLNKRGNLSNTNLEAINAGCCTLLLEEKNYKTSTEMTKKFLNPKIFWRINRKNTAKDLSSKIIYLFENIEVHYKLKKSTKMFAKKNLRSWDFRIKEEINIINSLIK